MSPAKVTLSPKELELVTDTRWILTKNGIIEKVYALFGEISKSYDTAIAQSRLASDTEIFQRAPKISKGEQYEGLPWVMLDQPRCYTLNDGFGIRSFFWWGNDVSITLQLSGKYRARYEAAIRRYFATQTTQHWWLAIGDDPWQHHFRDTNYLPLGIAQIAQQTSFLKLAKKFPLEDWDGLHGHLLETFQEMLNMLSA